MVYKNVFALLSIPLLLLGCSKANYPKNPPKKVQVTIKQPPFTRVNTIGYVDLELKPSQKGAAVTLIGDSRDVPGVEVKVIEQVLYLNAKLKHPLHAPLTAVIRAPHYKGLRFVGYGDIEAKNLRTPNFEMVLNSKGNVNLSGKIGLSHLDVKGKATVRIKGVSSRNLSIYMKDSPNIRLEGVADLRVLKFSGEGHLGLFWLDSPDLRVYGYERAKVSLAGIVHYLHVDTHDQSVMDGQYLRVDKAYVKAFDQSLIKLQPIRELNALAENSGRIYYYSEPAFKASYMSEQAAVLDYQPVT